MNTLAIDTATTALGLCLQIDSAARPVVEPAHWPKTATPSGDPRGQSRTLILQVGLKHSEKLMPAVRSLLEEAGVPVQELDLIICSTGPGSFTGIRIGLATAKGLADGGALRGERPSGGALRGERLSGYGAGNSTNPKRCRLFGVSTLDGLAHRFRRFLGLVVAVNPSLRKKYYAAMYRAGKLEGDYQETTLPDLCTALKKTRPILITGAAAGQLYELMLSKREEADADLVVDASGQSSDPAGLLACGLTKLGEPEREPLPLYLRKSEAEITFFGE
jgi:tRNA threonylcarbamoyladenosine biosynthesis protein TsaB